MAIVNRPAFNEELLAAGVVESRFSLTLDEGRIEFYPDVPEEERKKILAVLAAHDGPLSEARHQALEATRAEAGRRIADMFVQPPQTFDLVFAELNVLARAVGILEKGGSALPEERLDLDGLKDVWGRIQAIRQAGRDAKAALLGAKSVEEVQKVSPAWPKE